MLKALVFDFDGVIVNSEPLHYRAFLRVLEPLAIHFTYEQYLDDLVGYDDRDLFRVTLGRPAGVPAAAAIEAQVAQLTAEKAVAFEDVVNQGIEEIPGMRRFIEGAARTLPVGMASGASQRDIDLVLGKLGMRDWFEVIVPADQVARSKPDPQSYALAVDRLAQRHPELKLTPRECLAIEDTPAGIESARGAGLLVLGLASTGPASKLHRAHRVVESVEGLSMTQLQRWFG